MPTKPEQASIEQISALLRDNEPPKSPKHLDQLILAQASEKATLIKAENRDAKRWFAGPWAQAAVAFSMAGIALSVVLRAPVNELSREYASDDALTERLSRQVTEQLSESVTAPDTAPITESLSQAPIESEALNNSNLARLPAQAETADAAIATSPSPALAQRSNSRQARSVAPTSLQSQQPAPQSSQARNITSSATSNVADSMLEDTAAKAASNDIAFSTGATSAFQADAAGLLNDENLNDVSPEDLTRLFSMLDGLEGFQFNRATTNLALERSVTVPATATPVSFSERAAILIRSLQENETEAQMQQRFEQQRVLFSWEANLELPNNLLELLTILAASNQ